MASCLDGNLEISGIVGFTKGIYLAGRQQGNRLFMTITFARERPDTAEAKALIGELEAQLAPLYRQESRHGYSVEKLLQRGVAFFVLRYGGEPAGCGGIEFFGSTYGELKRMYVRRAFRGQGLGKVILGRLSDFARDNGISVLRLETGIYQAEAIALYENAGFRLIPPFGDYKEDPSSLFYEKRLEEGAL